MFLRTWYQTSGTSDAEVDPLEIDEDRRQPGRRIAAQEIQPARLLQLALDPLGHLLQRVVERRARPRRLHDHGPEGEGRILIAAEPEDTTTAPRASPRSSGKTVKDRCLRAHSERLSAHGEAPRRRTFWPDGGPGRPPSPRSRRPRAPARSTTVAGSKRSTSHVVQGDRHLRGIDEPYRRLAVDACQRAGRNCDAGRPNSSSIRPFTVAPRNIAARRVDQADAHPERARNRVGLRIDLCAPVPWR